MKLFIVSYELLALMSGRNAPNARSRAYDFFRRLQPGSGTGFLPRRRQLSKDFPRACHALGGLDINDLRISVGRQFSFLHWMFGVIPAKWTVVIREVGDRHFVDEMLKGTLRAFRHEHRVEAAEGGTLYTDRVTYRAIGGAPLEWLMVNAYMARIFDVRHRNMLRLLS